MPKSKKRTTKKHQSAAKIYGAASLQLNNSTLDELHNFMRKTEKHIYGDRWGMKHCVIQLDVNGNILEKSAFPYTVDYKVVLGNLIANPQAYALILTTEAWATTSTHIQRASLASDRFEVRTLQYVDITGRNTCVERMRSDNSTLEGEGVGRTVDYLADALGVVQTIQDVILARTLVFFSMLVNKELPPFARMAADQRLAEELGRPDAVEYFAGHFKTMAAENWAELGNDPSRQDAAIRGLYTEMPFETPGEMKPFLRDLYANEAAIPSWLTEGVKKAA